MSARARTYRRSAAALAAACLVLALGVPEAVADGDYSATATETASQTISQTVTLTRDVSASASWGAPSITDTATTTLTATATETDTETQTDTETATGDTPEQAQANASDAATFVATTAARIYATIVAGIAATTAASQQLDAQVHDAQVTVYNQALEQAKADVLTRDGPPTDTTPDACGQAQFKSDETRWTCTLDEEFDGTALNTDLWTAWDHVNHFGGDTDCFYDDPSHVSVADGLLSLSVTRLPAGATCATDDGITTPTYGAALVHTKHKFSQTYGLFQARIKFAGGDGIHDDFWLFPTDTSSHDHAEIDIAEPRGSLPDTMFHALHLADPADQDTELGTSGWCTLPGWADGFHTYGVQWTPGELQFTFDGTVCAVEHWQQLPGQPSTSPFDRDFFLVLESLADDGEVGPAPDETTSLPATTQVDWVHVWS